MTRKYLSLGLAALTAVALYIACSSNDDPSLPPPEPEIQVPPAAPNTRSAGVWRFGVMGDTQWATSVGDNDGKCPNTVAVEIIKLMNQQFISHGVDFVIQVGDVTDVPTVDAIKTTSKYRQDLYNAGIGFFTLRGNHENYSAAQAGHAQAEQAAEFARVFPQHINGVQNNLPADVLSFETTAGAAPKTNPNTFTIGANFSSPAITGYDYTGLTYSFTHKNATFVLLDQFTPKTGTGTPAYAWSETASINAQQPWITSVLSNRPYGNHAFVYAHKGLVHENHTDVLFGSAHNTGAAYQDNFIRSLAANNVKYFQSGHDHMHTRSIYTTTDGNRDTSVHHVVSASCSHKFYTPIDPAPDDRHNVPAFGVRRQTVLKQQLFRMGYYIYTVDGDNVTVDYYASEPVTQVAFNEAGQPTQSDAPDIRSIAREGHTFTKMDSWGYNLNGRQFIVAQGAPFNVVRDGAARILSGVNTFSMTDGTVFGTPANNPNALKRPNRKCYHEVTTGWTPKTEGLLSNIFTLWGMANEFGEDQTDTYCLSMAYDPYLIEDEQAKTGKIGIASRGETHWTNAVNKNFGGTKNFVVGPYDESKHSLGNYGVDLINRRFWVVVNYNGDFAVASSL